MNSIKAIVLENTNEIRYSLQDVMENIRGNQDKYSAIEFHERGIKEFQQAHAECELNHAEKKQLVELKIELSLMKHYLDKGYYANVNLCFK